MVSGVLGDVQGLFGNTASFYIRGLNVHHLGGQGESGRGMAGHVGRRKSSQIPRDNYISTWVFRKKKYVLSLGVWPCGNPGRVIWSPFPAFYVCASMGQMQVLK